MERWLRVLQSGLVCVRCDRQRVRELTPCQGRGLAGLSWAPGALSCAVGSHTALPGPAGPHGGGSRRARPSRRRRAEHERSHLSHSLPTTRCVYKRISAVNRVLSLRVSDFARIGTEEMNGASLWLKGPRSPGRDKPGRKDWKPSWAGTEGLGDTRGDLLACGAQPPGGSQQARPDSEPGRTSAFTALLAV